MEQRIPFQQRQGVPPVDLNALQEAVRVSVDAVVANLLVRAVYYKGLAVTKVSANEAQVGTGRFFTAGQAYRLDTALSLNLAPHLPAGANRKIIAIVASGAEVTTESDPRRFLTDATTRASVANTVATRVTRKVQIGMVEGAESLAPLPPTVAVDYALLALITLSSTGIVDVPVQQTSQIAPNLQDAVAAITVLQAQQALQAGLIATLRTDLAGLARTVSGLAGQSDVDRIEQALLIIREKLEIPDDASAWSYDSFATEDESDTTHGAYNARVAAGLHLPAPAPTSQIMTLLNPVDSRVKVGANGVMLPAWTETTRLEVASEKQKLALATYPVVTRTQTKQTQSIAFKWWKTRHGGLADTIAKTQGMVRLLDPATDTWFEIDIRRYRWRKLKNTQWGLWITIEDFDGYWDHGETTTSVSGATIAQTVLNAQAGWLTAVGINIAELATSGDLRVSLSGCREDGTPDLTRTLETVTVAYAALTLGWNRIVLPPAHLARGVRYAVVLQSAGAHKVWASDVNELTNGTAFTATDDVYWSGILAADLNLRLVFATFPQQLTIVELTSIVRAGGIDAMDFTATAIWPDAVDFDVQAQIAGVWRSIGAEDAALFAGSPNLVPLRMLWNATKDDAVGIVLAKSRVTATKAALAGVHISTARTLAAGTTPAVTVRQVLDGYDDAQHGHGVKLLHGAGYGTTKTAAAQSFTTRSDGRIDYVASFDFSAGEIASYKIRTEMTISDPAVEYRVTERWDHAAA
ncbi:hypothetical protein [Prosthecodimorpha staleyi]|uniref:Uncharacterized protein n=1 Tax=Prosthecodimorpha staleyi TaxID=2840188 RepID=A0A947D6K7_9HYPH|nr:hypothetical protein [Prosthecodimorpha staleyi]MBT9291856.1 hypothetical protein [Prosthecodimorpha staleyi]